MDDRRDGGGTLQSYLSYLLSNHPPHPNQRHRITWHNCKHSVLQPNITLSKFSFDLQSNRFRRMYKRHFALRWDSEQLGTSLWRQQWCWRGTLWMSVMRMATKLSCFLCFRSESGQCVGELWEEHVRAAGGFRTPRLSGRRWVGSSTTKLGEGLHREGRTLFHRSQLRYRHRWETMLAQIRCMEYLRIWTTLVWEFFLYEITGKQLLL